MSAVASWALLGAPALAALVGLPLGRRSRARAVGIGVGAAALALLASLALTAAAFGGQDVTAHPLGELDLGSRRLAPEWGLDATSALISVVVCLVALAVQVYSAGYLVRRQTRLPTETPAAEAEVARTQGGGSADRAAAEPPLRYAAYAAEISLFTAAMLVVVGARDLLLLLVGWEVMGLCSYLLVGHHSERDPARRAALQAFLVTRLADVGFVIGVVALYVAGGTTSIPQLLLAADSLDRGLLAVAATGLVVGVIGKSAQVPLHGWLPDAMEGPTPVSALIHAATMVAAGVVVLVRLGPLLDRSPGALALLAAVAGVSMLAAGFAALVADDLKRVLAWSTISQVAVMLSALSLASPAGRAGAVMLLLGHATFKSLLFLSAGAISTRFGTTRLDGLADLRRREPRLGAVLGVGLLGLAALPPLAGFVGKEGILTAAEHAVATPGHRGVGVWVLGCLLLTTVLTAGYSARLYAAVSRSDLGLPLVPTPTAAGTDAGAVPVGAEDGPPGAVPGSAPVTVPVTARRVDTVPLPDGSLPDESLPDGPLQDGAEGPRQGRPLAGPDFVPPVAAARTRGRGDSLAFVDEHGQLQDWDLISHLDTARPSRWSRQAREERTQRALDARRRLLAGHDDPQTRRLARRAPRLRPGQAYPAAQPFAQSAAQTAAEPFRPPQKAQADQADQADQAVQADQASQAGATNRLARAVAGQRPGLPVAQQRSVSPASGPVAQTGPLGRRSAGPWPEPPPGPPTPATMAAPLVGLAAASVLAAALPWAAGSALAGYEVGLGTAVLGSMLAIAGAAAGFLRGPDGERDPASRIPQRWRTLALSGYGYHRLQQLLVVRPVQALARLAAAGDDAVIGTWVQAPHALPWLGRHLGRVRTGHVSDYLGWAAGAAVVLAVAASLLSRAGG